MYNLGNLLTPIRPRFAAQVFLNILSQIKSHYTDEANFGKKYSSIAYFICDDQLFVFRVLGKEENMCFCGTVI